MTAVSRGNGPHVLRQLNAAAVLEVLRAAGPLRVSDLMNRTGLSRPTVTQATGLLEAEGWALTSPDADGPRLGRPAQLVRFNAHAGYLLGVDVGPHKALALVTDLAGTVVAERRADTSTARTGVEVMAVVKATMTAALRQAGVAPEQLYSVSLGTPGVVDASRGTVLLAPSIPGWTSISLLAELRDQFTCPIFIENDVNLAVLAEQWQFGAEPPGTLVFIQWGARLGAGILIGGRLHRGAASAAGEIGFIDLAETPTPAGSMGAFELMVGSDAITRLASDSARDSARDSAGNPDASQKRHQPTPDVSTVLRAAATGDPAAREVLEVIAARFARGIAPMLQILDPDLVVIGGGVSGGGPVLLESVARHLAARTMLPPRLALSQLGDRAVALGAIQLGLSEIEERLFSPAAFTNRAG
jgi:predicted NBD/HSP70 family sugar kinase